MPRCRALAAVPRRLALAALMFALPALQPVSAQGRQQQPPQHDQLQRPELPQLPQLLQLSQQAQQAQQPRQPQRAQQGHEGQQALLPVDQAAERPDFFSFRAQLQAALARRDAAALRAVLHPDIKNSFGGDDGLDGFETLWRPDAPDSPVWGTLAAVLALGGTFGPDGSFVAPYVFSRWPEGVDAFEHLAVIASGVRVRAAPEAATAPLARLDFAIVAAAATQPADERWAAVRLADGRSGFVDRRYVRSPIDYRAVFDRSAGRWQLKMFLAGD